MRDGLCGGIGGKFNSEKPLPSDLIEKNGRVQICIPAMSESNLFRSVVAIVLLGDPTHIANEPINRGTGSGKNGVRGTSITNQTN